MPQLDELIASLESKLKEPGQKDQLYCNDCLGIRRHTVMFHTERYWYSYDDEDGSPTSHERRQYTLAQCDGCDFITLVMVDDASFYPDVSVLQYPPQTIRKEPKWLTDLLLDSIISDTYKNEFISEIYIALRNNTPRLAVMGIRALLEQIMIEKVGDNGSFKKNLDKFEADGYISKVQRDAIDPVIEAGHASIHRGFKAQQSDVIHLMDVTENLIESIYINQKRSAQLNVPKRK